MNIAKKINELAEKYRNDTARLVENLAKRNTHRMLI